MWKRLAVLWTVVRGDAKLLWMALRHPRAPGWLKLGTLGIAPDDGVLLQGPPQCLGGFQL